MISDRRARFMMFGKLAIDTSDVTDIRRDGLSFYFDVNGREYVCRFYDLGDNEYEVKAGIKNGDDIQDIDVLGDINVDIGIKVTTNIGKSIILFLEEKPRSIKYRSNTKVRKRIFYRIIYSVNYFYNNILLSYGLGHNEDEELRYVLRNDVNIEDVIHKE